MKIIIEIPTSPPKGRLRGPRVGCPAEQMLQFLASLFAQRRACDEAYDVALDAGASEREMDRVSDALYEADEAYHRALRVYCPSGDELTCLDEAIVRSEEC